MLAASAQNQTCFTLHAVIIQSNQGVGEEVGGAEETFRHRVLPV